LNRYFKAKVIENLSLNSSHNLLTLEPIDPAAEPNPGQFYMIEAGDSYDPLLKRPFCYLQKTRETIQFLFRIKGKGTSLMRAFKKGKVISVIGPLGNGYPLPRKERTPLIVAGGTGIISLFSLIDKLSHNCHVFYGARNKDELLLLHELEKLGNKLIVCTNDCSFGKEGMVNEVLVQFLRANESIKTSCLIYTCGPKPMLQEITSIAVHAGIRGYVSMEENMACGFGACQGCVVKTISGYEKVCKEGPVFPIEDIVWA
jgi:dihydroorotate dehydrogenase electron transfer subunit